MGIRKVISKKDLRSKSSGLRSKPFCWKSYARFLAVRNCKAISIFPGFFSKKKKLLGYFFSIDALIAVILLAVVILSLPILYLDKKETTKLNFYSNDIIKVLSTLRIEEMNDAYIENLKINGTILARNQSVLEEIGRLWVLGYKPEATALVGNLTYGLIEDNVGFGMYMGNDVIYTKNESDSNYVLPAKHMVSGIEPGKPISGLSSRVFLSNADKKTTSIFSYFGGYVGNGNISQKMFIPNASNIISADLELDVVSSFDLYINGNYSGHFYGNPNELVAENFTINSTYYPNFKFGDNIIKIGFTDPGLNYIGGGFIKIKYSTEELSQGAIEYYGNDVVERNWLPGIEGVINLYSSFYVPGNLNSIEIYLHYLANHTLSFNNDLILKIGNNIVLIDSNSTTEQLIALNNSYLASYLNYSFLSEKTIPLRFGFVNLTPVDIRVGSYMGDTALTTDLSGSMDTCDVDDSSHLISGDCSWSAGDQADRIDVAKYVDKYFVNYILNTSGNRVGLASYSTTLLNVLDLSNDEGSLNSTINAYASTDYTCISCGEYGAIDLLLRGAETYYLIKRNSNWVYNLSYPESDPPDDINGYNWISINYSDSGWANGSAAFSSQGNVNTILYSLLVNLSEKAQDLNTPALDFNSGIESSGNTYCHPPCALSAVTIDGWDWDTKAYTTNDDDTARTKFRTPNGESGSVSYTNALTGKNDWIQVEIRNDRIANDDSGAFGIQFNITPKMYDIISKGGTAKLSFDYWADDMDNDLEKGAWIKARFGNGTFMAYLGSNLDTGHTYSDTTPEIWSSTNNPNNGFEEGDSYGDGDQAAFTVNVSQYINKSGYYYLDLGAKGRGDYSVGNEGFVASFDNIMLIVQNKSGDIYFRKKFNITNVSQYKSMSLFVSSDDYADVFINEIKVDNDSQPHAAEYWNREADIPLNLLNEGQNQIAVKIYNSDALFSFDLALGEKRRQAMVVMSDGEANYCHGPADGIIDNNTWEGDCSDSLARNETVTFACNAHEKYGINIFAVAFGNAGATSIANLNQTACCDQCSHFYTSTNASGLLEIYANIVEELNKITVERTAQTYNVSGNFTGYNILYTDSYIRFNYTPTAAPLEYGEVPITVEGNKFGNTYSNGSFVLPQNAKVADVLVTSYSGKKWTNLLQIKNQSISSPVTVFNLSVFSDDYKDAGDPYIIHIPINYVGSGNNTVTIHTGSNSSDIANGSRDDKTIITLRLSLEANYSNIYPKADGCLWYVEFEDNTNTILAVPPGYSGSKTCFYKNLGGSLNFSFDVNDSIDQATYSLFNNLDIDNNGKLYVNFNQNGFDVNTMFIKDIPYLWGPTLIEARTWQ